MAVLKGVPFATIEAQAEILLRLPQSGERIFRSPLRVTLRGGEIRVGGRPVPDGVEAQSRAGNLKLEGKSYRGVLVLGRRKGGLLVLNRLGVDTYVKDVVPKEMLASWLLEALKAQAVAARTYILYQVEKRRDQSYHVDVTVRSQVYRGGVRWSGRSRARPSRRRGERSSPMRGNPSSLTSTPIAVALRKMRAPCGGSASLIFGRSETPTASRQGNNSESTPFLSLISRPAFDRGGIGTV